MCRRSEIKHLWHGKSSSLIPRGNLGLNRARETQNWLRNFSKISFQNFLPPNSFFTPPLTRTHRGGPRTHGLLCPELSQPKLISTNQTPIQTESWNLYVVVKLWQEDMPWNSCTHDSYQAGINVGLRLGQHILDNNQWNNMECTKQGDSSVFISVFFGPPTLVFEDSPSSVRQSVRSKNSQWISIVFFWNFAWGYNFTRGNVTFSDFENISCCVPRDSFMAIKAPYTKTAKNDAFAL